MSSLSIRRVAIITAATAGILVIAGLAVLEWRWRRHFDVPYPPLATSADPIVVARGEYLVYNAAACAYLSLIHI